MRRTAAGPKHVRNGRVTGDSTDADPEFVERVVADTTERILDALESDLDAERDAA